jgi:hypothetical protein
MRWKVAKEPRRVAIEGRIGFERPRAWEARNTSVRTYLLTNVGVIVGS